MEIRRLRTLAVEIFKTINEIYPPCMKNIFTPRENAKVSKNNIIVKSINTSRFVIQILRSLGQKTWSNLPSNIWKYIEINTINTYNTLKGIIKTWLGPKCRCKICINKWTENVLWFLYIKIYQFFIYIYSYLYFLKILARIWSVFMHGVYFFSFVYMQIYIFPSINKAFIHSFMP